MAFLKQLLLIAILGVIYIKASPAGFWYCPPGRYWFPFLGCKDCQKGNYCPGGGPWALEYGCLNGTFTSKEGSANCTECPAGHECSHKDQDPKVCPLGQYSPAKSMSCFKCPKDHWCIEPQFKPYHANPPTPVWKSAINRYAQFAAAAYYHHNTTDETTPFWEHFSHGFISHKGNEIVVAFRGTKTFDEWVADVTFTQALWKSCAGCKVHVGFKYSYEQVRKYIIPVVKDYLKKWPNAALYVTGHSLGGAQATVCASDLAEQGFHPNLITFGSPRVGNRVFAKYVNEAIVGSHRFNVRVTYRRDIFTVLPDKKISTFLSTYFYQHVGNETHYEDYDRAIVLPELVDLDYKYRTIHTDHSIDNYKKLH